MRKRIFFAIPILLVILSADVVSQESDSKMVEQYLESYQNLKNQLQLVARSSQLHDIENDLLSLVDEYRENEVMINYGVYPRSFSKLNEELFIQIQRMETQLLIIENQQERLLVLTNQVASYRNEISKLNSRADSLRKSIAESEASEARLSQLVADYRKSMERRDALVFDMLDSLMLNYQGYSMINPGDINSELIQESISTEQNPLALISNVVRDNIEFTAANTVYASVDEHLRMYALQNHFNNVWDKVGDDMIEVYGGSDKAEWDADIQTQLREWRMTATRKMWNSIDQYLEFNGIELTAFDNGESFFEALDAYLDYGLQRSGNEFLTNNAYQDYLNVHQFWNSTFKNEWKEADLLTVSQVAEIDTKLGTWEETSRPIHPALIVIVSMLIVSLSGFVLVMLKARASKAY